MARGERIVQTDGRAPDINVILGEFEAGEKLRALFKEAWDFLDTMEDIGEVQKFMERFSGATFQWAAYTWMRRIYRDKLKDPKETREFYSKLFPNARPTLNPFGMSSLEGISVPDGLVYKTRNGKDFLRFVCEFTLFSDSIERKLHAFRMDKEQFPETFFQTRILFVLLENTTIPEDILRDPDVSLRFVPLNHTQFGHYIHHLYSHYRPALQAETLKERMSHVLTTPATLIPDHRYIL